MAAVPVIDISPYGGSEADKRALAQAVDQACRDIGFLVISGHGVSEELIARLNDVTWAFFDLAEAAKRKYLPPSPTVFRGFSPMKAAALGYSLDDQEALPDLRELFTINRIDIDPDDPYYSAPEAGTLFAPNIWPAEIDGFRETWEAYYRAMEDLARRIMRIFALALGLDEPWFDRTIDKHFTNLCASFYPAQETPPAPGQLRGGAHTDFGSVTIVLADGSIPGGLEVQTHAGDWERVEIPPGAFAVNLGDLMAQWTNDRWVSTMHRVGNPPPEVAAESPRLSFLFFHQPNYDALIECIPTCQGPDAPPKYAPITSGEHLFAKLSKMMVPEEASE